MTDLTERILHEVGVEEPGRVCDIDWPEPVPIIVGSTTPFPVDALPPMMGAAVTEVAANLIVDPALPATAFLGVAAGAVGASTEVIITETWRRHCNLYLAVVALSGDGKTPASAPALDPLHALEQDLINVADEKRRKAKVLLPVLKRQLDEMQKAAVVDVMAMATLQATIEDNEHDAYREARMVVDDVTPERLAELMADNNGHMTAVNDEGSLFRHLLGLYSGKTPNLDPFLKSWDGNPLTVDRKGGNGKERTALRIGRPLLTMVAAVQPTTIEEIGKPAHRDLVERGVVGRVLLAWPQSTAGERMMAGREHGRYRHVDPWNADVLREARQGLQVVTFSTPALAEFLTWHDEVESGLPLGRVFADVREFAVKIRDAVGRIAGLFARLDGSSVVHATHVRRAIRLGGYYLDHAQAVVEAWSTAPTQVARRLVAKLPPTVKPATDGRLMFTVRDAARMTRATTDVAIEALELLEAHGYCRPANTDVGYGVAARSIGKKPSWVVLNPRWRTDGHPIARDSTDSADI